MFCTNCGKENPQGTLYCTGCGQSLQGNSPVYTAQHSIYAGFWKRVGATLIDGLLLGIVFGIPFSIIINLLIVGPISDMNNALSGSGMIGSDEAAVQSLVFPLMMKMILVYSVFCLIGTVIYWLYFALMESSSKQGTLGKMALGIKVTDLDGNRISFKRATGRYFGRILSGMIMYIGFIMVAFTEKKQGLHDMLAKTLVINK